MSMEPTTEARQQGERLCGCRICFEEGACSRAIAIATALAAKDAEIAQVVERSGIWLKEARAAQVERDNLNAAVNHRGAECHFCGNRISLLAGDPGQWPLYFCFGDDSGVVKTFHTQCVTDRLAKLDNLKAEVERLTQIVNYRHSSSYLELSQEAATLKAEVETWKDKELEQRTRGDTHESFRNMQSVELTTLKALLVEVLSAIKSDVQHARDLNEIPNFKFVELLFRPDVVEAVKEAQR